MKNSIIIISIIILCNACNSNKAEPQPTAEVAVNGNIVSLTKAQAQNAKIQTTTLMQNNIASVVKVNGVIDVPPQNLISVSVPMGGYLRSTKLLPGMHISKGEIIAVVEDQQYIQLQQDYLLTKSKLHFATLEYNRQKELNQSQASSDKVTQQAQAELQSNRILLSSLTQKLKLININPSSLTEDNVSKSVNIYSTISGFVSKINANIGKYVNPSEVLFELVNPSDIHLNIKVFEKDISKLSIGQHLIAYTNAQPERKFNCQIILISKDISTEGTTEVHCHFDTYDKTLLPGMYMNAEIEVASQSVNTLPEESIVNFEGKNFVFIKNENKQYEMQEVQIGNKENGYVEILNHEILQSKTIVSTNAYTLLMKMKNTEE